MDYPNLPIRKALEFVLAGQIRVPAFQRGFVWDMDKVAYFMDSLYKQYPFGSLLFWRTNVRLEFERNLGPYTLPEADPDFPIDYVLDGQQRLTSIFGVFQTQLDTPQSSEWLPVYFDFRASPDAQDSQFQALPPEEADPDRYFPMRSLFDSIAYREATESLKKEVIPKVDNLQSVFKETAIPAQQLRTEDRTKVAIVFERVNRLGVELDTLQLLTAWTWSEEFDLQNKFADLREELQEYGFSQVGEDTNLVLRCCAAVINGDPSAESLINLNGARVRDEFSRVEQGIRGAVDFLRDQLHVESLKNLPFPALLVPLSVFFAEPEGKQISYKQTTLALLRKWFWRACFARRYSGQTIRAAGIDIKEMQALKEGGDSDLGGFRHKVAASFFTDNQFRMAAANTKTFILLLAHMEPLSFISGQKVDLGRALQSYNRTEFHHLYPHKVLKDENVDRAKINALANFCFLSRADNNRIGKKKPSEYRSLMPDDNSAFQEILGRALVPESLFEDQYDRFLAERTEKLFETALYLVDPQ